MKNRFRRIFLQIKELKNYYLLLASLCLICAVIGIFVLELLQGARLLRELSYLPFEQYHLVTSVEDSDGEVNSSAHLWKGGYSVLMFLDYYENVEDVMTSELCTSKVQLHGFGTDMTVSENDAGTFPITAVPYSEYDDAFRDAERYLTAGRHIQRDDTNTALMDAELAEANGLRVGDSFSADSGEVYTIVGLFKTIKVDSAIFSAVDVPHNMLFVSDRPSEAKTLDIYNMYVSFKYPYSEEERAVFAEQITSLTVIGGYTRYELTPVDELNRNANRGVTSMLQLSVCCAAIMFVIITVALYMFISSFIRRRRREFLLYNALGKAKTEIIADFSLEILCVVIPSVLVGVIISNVLCIGYIKDIIYYFEKMVSAETIHATSTLSLQKNAIISSGLYDRLLNTHYLADSLLFLGGFVLIALVCVLVNSISAGKWSIMKMLSER